MLALDESLPMVLGIVPNAACYHMLVTQQQYYVPIKHMATVADANLIALYMSAWHPTHPQHVTHVAQIDAYTIQPRSMIWPLQQTHPRVAQLYVVLSLSALALLTPAIPSPRWHRISIHRTTSATLARLPYLGHTPLRRMPHHHMTD
ncbi:MAG: hypothetical protein ACK5C8_10350 [Roseiflexaceae bacterium]|jgi:hypothetical protein